jgi:hypothetical protein
MLTVIALVLVLICGSTAPMRAQDASTRFPDPAQVAGDYPDDAQR